MTPASLRSARPRDPVLVIAHRGASGYRPEHTLEAYALAVEMGADYIEPDVVVTRDGVLVVRHENEISGTTDVARRPAFADRRTTKVIDGEAVTGWFAEDFTLAEVRTLRAVERLPHLRPGSARYDGRFVVPTLEEVVALAASLGAARGRPVGLYPETKHPSYFDGIGLPLEGRLVEALHAAGWRGPAAPAFLQSFEVGSLRALADRTDLPLILLAEPGGRPYDRAAADDPVTYDDLLTAAGLADLASWIDGIGVHKAFVLPPVGAPGGRSPLVERAHAVGLEVHVWTVRAENAFLPPALQRAPGDPAGLGDVAAEVRALAEAGVDAVFADQPDLALAALGRP